jgi:hypothetical protein
MAVRISGSKSVGLDGEATAGAGAVRGIRSWVLKGRILLG